MTADELNGMNRFIRGSTKRWDHPFQRKAQRIPWHSGMALVVSGLTPDTSSAAILNLIDFLDLTHMDEPSAGTFVPQLHILPANQFVKISFFGSLTMGKVGRPEMTSDGVLLAASLLDLMGSKLKVIQQRAEKKDYLDIHKMLEHGVRLDQGLAAGRVLYGRTFQPSEALKALAYFGDGNLRELPAHIREALIQASASVKRVPVLTAVSSGLGLGAV